MTGITRRTTLGALGSLAGLGLIGAASLVSVDAKKHKHKKKKKHKKGNKGNNNTGGNTPPPGGGNTPPPPPQFKSTTLLFTHDGAVGIDTQGPVKEYPSEIVVSGLDGGIITKVTARFPGFQHDFPDDVDVMLVGPQGQNVLLMSDAGGAHGGTELFDLTFDDEASQTLPTSGPLSDGSFRPTNFGDADVFPAPAPSPDFTSTLAVFNGTDPTGTWQLFIVDDNADDGGVLINGWSLTITALVPV